MISHNQTAELADIFHLMGDPSRLRIILACLDGPKPVGGMAEELGLSQSLVSHHLRLLRAARIVRAEREGRHIFYEAADAHIKNVLTDMIEHLVEPRNTGN